MISRSTDGSLTIATRNQGKVREIRRILQGLPFTVRSVDEVLPGPSPRETGRTFADNARSKAVYYSRRIPGLVLAEDSGLEVDLLDGAPGVYSARFSRPDPTDEKNLRKLLRLMKGAPAEKRRAGFTCAVALAINGKVVKVITGRTRGRIAEEASGSNGFGYDPVFYSPRLHRTFAELSPEEKNSVSHRGRAFRELRRWLEKRTAAEAAPPRT